MAQLTHSSDLTVTQAQYDIAKDIILDLLGWGVPPEYLVNCGLSREIIYYAFIELNLRLPNNLDTTGLLPPLPTSNTFSSPEPITPPPHAPRTRGGSSARRSVSDLHPSLPQKPSAPQGTSSSDGTTLSATATPFVPSASLSAIPMQSSDSPPSLIDMEQQRRQELLARKAVLASRKKHGASGLSTAPTTAPLSETTPSIASATVDDFLKSIGSANGDATGGGKSDVGSSEDQMDVDDQIPGLSLALAPQNSGPPVTRSSSSDSVSPNSIVFPPPPDSESSVRSSSAERNSVPSTEGSSSGDSTPRPSSVGPRRITKRPVASDFVDMDLGNSRSHGHHHHNAHNNLPYPRRKLTSFAGLTTHSRRMVIDLSDSEEEEVEDIITHPRPLSSRQPSRPPTRLGVSSSLPTLGSPSTSGLATPTALHEKELEIKKMRELIAQRERARMDKLAAVSVVYHTPTFS